PRRSQDGNGRHGAPAQTPRLACVSRRGRDGDHPRAARAAGGGRGDSGNRGSPGGVASAGTSEGRRGRPRGPAGRGRSRGTASRVVMRHDADGRITEVGARTRTIPPALRRALEHRDQGCRFPGCNRQLGQGHHIRHWARGGPTTLSNLTMLCRRHHRAVHEEGYQVERQPDGELQFRRPNGWVIPEVPRSPDLPADPLAAIRAWNEANGLALNARTTMPGWLGE